ncbi:hypothetical protein LCGC14_2307780, partial [marine sediment metagenome]
RTASNTFIVRDRATGQELFKGATKEDAERFINDSGQDGTVVFDGNIPIDTDIPGNVMPPPSPGLRVNEPFDFPPNTKVGTIIDGLQAITPFFTPFKDWSAAADNILGTRIFSEIYIDTQGTKGRSTARALPWLRRLRDEVEKIFLDEKMSMSDRENAFMYIETMNIKDLLGSHKKGLGPLKNRSATADEISSYELIMELDVGTQRLYDFIRLRETLFDAEARILETTVENLDPIIKESIINEIIEKKDITPNEIVGIKIFDLIRTQDLNDNSLYVVSRLVEADRGNALSRADFAAKNKMTAAQIKAANRIEAIQDEIAALPDVPIDDIRLIRGYMPHYASQQTVDPANSILFQPGQSRDVRFVNALIRSGETDVYAMDPIAVTAKYIKNAFDAAEGFNDAVNKAQRYIDTELRGKDALATVVASSYLNEIKGIPKGQFTQKIVDAVFKKMGLKIELNIRRDIVNTVVAQVSAAFLGGRPGLAGRDLLQVAVLLNARFGAKRSARALVLAQMLGSEGTKALRDSGELPSIGIVEFETAAQLEASAIGKTMGKLPATIRRVSEVALTTSLQRSSYE